MILNQYGECILNEGDIISGFYSGKITDLSKINIIDETIIQKFNKSIELNADDIPKADLYLEPICSVDEFDKENQKIWNIPLNYQQLDISNWLLEQCKTTEETIRIIEELKLFDQHNMIDVLKCLKYLVDFMREHNIVWGVGRGSSVSSFCLYLIGIHKINSIKYDLDIREFLKGNNNG